MRSTLVQDLTPGQEVRGVVHVCTQCGVLFIARAHAQTCSNACRMREKRKREKDADDGRRHG